jgi:ABC-type iron transport system FetAB permease component
MIKEENIRKQVKSLKRFYMESFTFAIVNAVLILVWAVTDRDATFWPKYVILIWGIALIFKAYRMGVLPLFFHQLSFLTTEWEEQKVKELIGGAQEQRRIYLNRNKKK